MQIIKTQTSTQCVGVSHLYGQAANPTAHGHHLGSEHEDIQAAIDTVQQMSDSFQELLDGAEAVHPSCGYQSTVDTFVTTDADAIKQAAADLAGCTLAELTSHKLRAPLSIAGESLLVVGVAYEGGFISLDVPTLLEDAGLTDKAYEGTLQSMTEQPESWVLTATAELQLTA